LIAAIAPKKDDKTIEDFKTEAANQTVDNDTDWVDFEQQPLNLRRKEVSRKGFWGSQDKEVLKRVYKGIFPGIADAVKDTEGGLLDVIGEDLLYQLVLSKNNGTVLSVYGYIRLLTHSRAHILPIHILIDQTTQGPQEDIVP
jgi:hypothetical protein